MLSTGLRGRAQVLVVEDEGIVANDIEKSLQELGFEVSGFALSADEALERATEKCPDLVLMDIRIQGKLDGIETAMLLRQRFQVPIVYLTAHGDAETIERAKKTEPMGYLLKPFKKSELRSVIDVALFRHEVEKRRQIRERFYETALHSAVNGILTVDATGKILQINKIAQDLSGWTESEAIGRPLSEVFRLLDAPKGNPLPLNIGPSMSTSSFSSFNGFLAHRTNGSQQSIACNLVPVADSGQNHGSVLFFTEESGEFSDRLRTLGTMAAGMVHDISSPLGSLILNLDNCLGELKIEFEKLQRSESERDLLLKRFDEIIKNLEGAAKSADHLRKVVVDFKRYCRRDEGPSGLIDIKQVLEWAIDATKHEIRRRARLVLDLKKVPPVRGSETRLGQVFINLLVNAGQAFSAESIPEENEIRIATRTDSSGHAIIEISDTGSGMSVDTRNMVFTPFFTTKAAGIGTGLGLSICHGIVKAAGGSIEVESELNKGSVFRVRLPNGDLDSMSNHSHAKSDRDQSKQIQVLIIEDEPMIAAALKQGLGPNHNVVCATRAKQAVSLFVEGKTFDVILCDLNMPEMTGIQFYEQLLRTHPDQAKRIVFMSGDVANTQYDDFLKAIPNRTIEKPFRLKDLRSLIREVA